VSDSRTRAAMLCAAAIAWGDRSSLGRAELQAQRQLDLPTQPEEQSFPSAFLPRLLLSVLRAGDVLLRVYRAGDRLVRGILR
jgi:hypothetical protein